MAQDLLAAIGSRLEAQLKARDARLTTVEDAVKARVNLNPPAPFSLLADGTKQFGYAPSVDTAVYAADSAANIAEAAAQTEDISDPGASFAALVSATAQLFTGGPAESRTAAADASIGKSMAIMPANQKPVTLAADSVPAGEPMLAQILTPTVPTTTATEATTSAAPSPAPATAPAATAVAAAVAATVETPATATTAATTMTPSTPASTPAATNTAAVTANAAARVSGGFVMLADGTKQFGYAPTGGTPGLNAIPNKTPPVPIDFGEGATIRRKGVGTDTPMTVTRVGDGVIFANFTDSEGTREMAFYPNQMDLVTAAP